VFFNYQVLVEKFRDVDTSEVKTVEVCPQRKETSPLSPTLFFRLPLSFRLLLSLISPSYTHTCIPKQILVYEEVEKVVEREKRVEKIVHIDKQVVSIYICICVYVYCSACTHIVYLCLRNTNTNTNKQTHTHTQVMVDKVVERPKIVYVDVPLYTNKVVQKIVEKFVEVPVEKIVYQVGSASYDSIHVSE